MNMDEMDRKIVNLLSENSKLSFRRIAKVVGVSTVTVMKRVRGLEKEGIITNYGARLDYEKMGYGVGIIVDVRVSKGRLFDVERRIASHPNVHAVYDTTGQFDATVLASFKNTKDLDIFLKKIQTYDFVERTETRLILNTMKDRNIKV